MYKFTLFDRYRLELRWGKAVYNREGVCEFAKAQFMGPALSEAVRLEDSDHIMLDFFRQYYVLTKNVYVAKFSWHGVQYNKDGSISLKEAIMAHDTEINRVPILKNDDYLIIDTNGHEIEDHPFNTVYKTFVVNNTSTLYNFGGQICLDA